MYPLSHSTLCTRHRFGLQRLSARSAPLRSVTSAVVTATACGKPWVSTAMWRLMPETFLSSSIALQAHRVRVLDALRAQHQECRAGVVPQFLSGHANLIFKACSRTLMLSWSDSLHLAKYKCTVRHLGNSLGKNLHWHPVHSRYNTAQNTSYRSTAVSLVRLRTLCSSGRISSNFSGVMSLEYFFLIPIISAYWERS